MQRRAGGSAVDAMQGACRCLRVQCSNDSGGTMPNVHGCLILCQWRAGSIATPQACPRLGPPFQPASSRPAGAVWTCAAAGTPGAAQFRRSNSLATGQPSAPASCSTQA